MSDTEKSGAPTSAPADLTAAAPAPTVSSPATPTASSESANAPAAFGSFGGARGSGLARGKRPAIAVATSSAPAAPAGYKPSAVEVITPQTEYKNPFTGETTVTAPRANEPAPPAVPLPSVSAVKEESAQAPVNSPIPESSASLDAAFQSNGPETVEPEIKPELKILPPEGPRRTPVRWETNAPVAAPAAAAETTPPRAEERRTFQPSRERRENREPREVRENREGQEGHESREPRDGRPAEPRQPRDPREQREPRRHDRRSEPRGHSHQPERRPQPQSEPEKKSGGFIGWLKGIFGGGTPPAATSDTAAEPRRAGEHPHGQGGQRGGRSRGGQGGFRGENRGPQGAAHEGGDDRGEGGDQAGRRRRRRRGGRGRSRGDGGDRGPRPEGQQGGGAI